jgi:uncharacterized membrane protein
VRKTAIDGVLAEINGFRGKVLKTSLTEHKEKTLREVLSGTLENASLHVVCLSLEW